VGRYAGLGVLGIGGLLVLVGLARLLRRQDDPVIRKLIVAGLAAKLVGSVARFTVMADLYDGRGDFNRYFENGVVIASQLRSGTVPDQATETGTPFMDFLVGVFYVVAPSQLWVGFFAFALLSFVGALLFLLAFQLALPEGNHRLYAALVFFTPTMVFWPSSIGKEAWLVFTLGLAAYGAARTLRGARFGYPVAALGATGAFMVRPHMGALFALCFAGAFLLRIRDRTAGGSRVGWALGLVVIAGATVFAVANFGDELPQDQSIDGRQTDQILAETARRTTQGGSEFDSRPVRGPGDLGHALLTVPFRPFPTEGHNVQAQLAGLEGVVLLLVLLLVSPRLIRLPHLLLSRPYVALASAYALGFVVAFSNVGNFGILTRQRAQLLPFLFVLFALPQLSREEPRTSGPVLVPVSRAEQLTLSQRATGRPPDPSIADDAAVAPRAATNGAVLTAELPPSGAPAPQGAPTAQPDPSSPA
jgi:hypothetical protein